MPPSEEAHKALVPAVARDVVSRRDASAADRSFAPAYRNDIPGRAPGREGLKAGPREFFAAFPDADARVELLVAEGDLVACRKRIRATHQGAFLGAKATGRRVEIALQEISRIEHRLIAESWITFDAAGFLAQVAPSG